MNGLAKKRFLENFYLKPQALFTINSKANEFLIGSDVGLTINEDNVFNDFHVGVHYRGGYSRNSDALIVKTGFNYSSFDFAIAYDLGISDQKISNFTSNAFEISVIFTRPETKIRERTIPRYILKNYNLFEQILLQ